MNFKQFSHISTSVFWGVLYNLIFIGIYVGIVIITLYLFDFLNDIGIPYTKFLADNPEMIILALAPYLIYSIRNEIREESNYYSSLCESLLNSSKVKLRQTYKHYNILSKLKIFQSYTEYELSNNEYNTVISFYESGKVLVEIKCSASDKFKVSPKASESIYYNLLDYSDSSTDKDYLKKVFSSKPRNLKQNQIDLVFEMISLFNDYPEIILDESKISISINKKFDPNYRKQISSFLDKMKEIPSILKHHQIQPK